MTDVDKDTWLLSYSLPSVALNARYNELTEERQKLIEDLGGDGGLEHAVSRLAVINGELEALKILKARAVEIERDESRRKSAHDRWLTSPAGRQHQSITS